MTKLDHREADVKNGFYVAREVVFQPKGTHEELTIVEVIDGHVYSIGWDGSGKTEWWEFTAGPFTIEEILTLGKTIQPKASVVQIFGRLK